MVAGKLASFNRPGFADDLITALKKNRQGIGQRVKSDEILMAVRPELLEFIELVTSTVDKLAKAKAENSIRL